MDINNGDKHIKMNQIIMRGSWLMAQETWVPRKIRVLP